MKVPISIAIITKNEESMLPDCLKSVSFADDIVVVDSGSTDRTVEIAKEHGCRVFEEQWKGFGPQKQSAIEKCVHDWILVLDADERIPEETRAEIERAIREPKADAYSFLRENYFLGKKIRHGGWETDEVTRFFRKGKARMSGRLVHEVIEVGSTARITAPILHYPVRSLAKVIDKINLYSTLGAEELLKNGRRCSIITAAIKGMAAFFKIYVIKLGILEGYEGFVMAFSHGVNTCFKYLKLREASQRK